MGPAGEPIEAVFREERGRLLALLAARFGDLDLAEEVTAEALLAAVETWPRSGVPREPLAWLATTARRKALDRIRRDATLATKLATLHADADPARRTEPVPEHEHIPDDRLQLMFACCHPALDLDTQTGLTLRYCCPALKMPMQNILRRFPARDTSRLRFDDLQKFGFREVMLRLSRAGCPGG